ncbi:ubiquitin carboxyl-terminal hydrolase [Diplodia corticola]|uniref:Ubiquitin carboxyl-terminal hydrolase n=1 Tax=Diplodia corticola TaxID=236234 RepID=A0A1J9R6C0_9PEZI|nr:ubiquitin carboxyl-terminal hydrolase [Diplodia corticola]OJD36097.1 ubiquitin carboxyl-terminal hydrolase [Diplodia corticola]
MEAQHAMDLSSLRNCTPPASLESPEERRDSMEDADCSPSRFKRPRLDSGSRAVRKMSQDLDQAAADSLADPGANAPATPMEQHEQTEDTVSRTPNTPSRITLNLRLPQNPSHTRAAADLSADPAAHPDEASDQMAADSDSDSSTTLRSSPCASSHKSKIHTPSPDSERTDSALSPTAASSPVVEVAVDDADDMDNSSDNLVEVNEEDEDEVVFIGNIFDDFPFAKNYGRETALGGMLNLIAKPRHGTDGELTQLKGWLHSLAELVHEGKLDAYTTYLQEPVFWDEIAKMFHRIVQRQIPYGEAFHLDPGHGEVDALRDLWGAYAECVAQMLKVEINALETGTYSINNSRMVSLNHMKIMREILRFREDLPFWVLMHDLVGQDPVAMKKICSTIMSNFVTELNGTSCLVSLVRMGIAEQNLRLAAEEVLTLLTWLAAFAVNWRSGVSRNDRRWMAQMLFSLFKEVDQAIQTSLKAPIDLCIELVSTAVTTLQSAAHLDADIARQLAAYIYKDSRDAHQSLLIPEVLQMSWSLKTLEQYVLKGHMAHRIYAIENLNQQFISVWTTWSQKSPDKDILHHFAQILLEDKIIDYIIGVDSHPQLVSRSGNIVGFLAVTGRYGEAQTDAIWDAITQSQDPRMAEALIEMTMHTVLLMSNRDLLYLCTKFNTLPPSSFSVCFVELFKRICDGIQKKARADLIEWTEEPRRMAVFSLCVYLAQETYPFPIESSAPFLQLMHRTAIHQLALFSRGEFATADDKAEIYRTCASGIAGKTPQAAANAEIIFTMLSAMPTDSDVLLRTSVVEDVSEELCSFVAAEKNTVRKGLEIPLTSRLQLLFYLMNISPTSLAAGTEKKVWDHLVGPSAIGADLQDVAWHHLSSLARLQVSKNEFLDICAAELLPTLKPDFYTTGSFDFLRELADYQRRTSTEGEITSDGIFQPPFVDLLWHVILTAPHGTIERITAEYLASFYLDPQAFNQHTEEFPNIVQDTHTALIDRCINQMVTAYSALKNSEKMSTSDEVKMEDKGERENSKMTELQFRRTLLFLTVLLGLVKQRPDLQVTSPRLRRPDVPARVGDTVGDMQPIKFQAIGPDIGRMQTVEVGDLQSLSWLAERLRDWTGFCEFRMIHGGAPLDLQALGDRTIRDLSLHQKGAILVKNVGELAAAAHGRGSSSLIEKEILNNYDTIFDFLDGGDDSMSEAAYDFLNQLPPHGKALAVTYGGRQTESIPDIIKSSFSPGKLFKARISVSTLRKDFGNQLRSGLPLNVQLISHSVQLLNAVIQNEGLIDDTLSGPHNEFLAQAVLETFTELLMERVDAEVSASYFDNETRLTDRLISFLRASLSASNVQLAYQCYVALLEAFNHSSGVWNRFKTQAGLDDLHYTLLVSNDCEKLRKSVATNIENEYQQLSGDSPVSKDEFVSFYWNILTDLLPRVSEYSKSCQQLFDVSVKMFRWYDEHRRDEDGLRSYISAWSELLLAHEYEACVGRPKVDFVVSGFAQLLGTAVSSLKSFKKPLNIDGLAANIFTKFLFPRASDGAGDRQLGASEALPVLETKTRDGLYELITALCEDTAVYKQMVGFIRELLHGNNHAEDVSYVLSGSRDLRSDSGYVGLENPQALCYMNSMMTQLFMDIEFRKFVFEAECGTQDGLLNAMQELFATMQSSYARSVDMKPFAHCVRGIDKKPINVAIQMDTEEFFRLLMDQLESELLTAADKQRLRNFYGGRSVNQIKSKDCQHVSETTETLFNLPLEVKGKETLEDSLKAYVEGESLEGENKYKCEPCGGRLVNAVKRTCLQSVPDNLIVHLKRFDFDPFTMTRSKINDYFRFPSRINMSPYKVEYLSDPDQPIEDDFFELVGILVHAGGVEQGHYWSYVRIRPDNQGHVKWIKFNDDTVTEQDLGKVENECFGGNGRHTSAYMLLYQRASSLDKDGTSVLRAPQSLNPIAAMPKGLEERVRAENERHIREYCMLDQAHTGFIRKMLAQMRTINKGVCSDGHGLEKCVINMGLEHMYEVIGRGQDLEELVKFLSDLKRTISPCTECIKLALDWISKHEQALPDWFIYSYQADSTNPVGYNVACFIIDALRELRDRDPSRYGVDVAEPDLEQALEENKDGALPNILSRMMKMAPDLGYCPRGLDLVQHVWDIYFKFLFAVAEYGKHEVALLLHHGFLMLCLEIYSIESIPEADERHPRIKKAIMRKGSTPSFVEMTSLVSHLLQHIDLETDVVPSSAERIRPFSDSEQQKFPFARPEYTLFYRWDKKNNCLTVLNRLLETWDTNSQQFAPGNVLSAMMAVEPEAGHLKAIHITIHEGVELLMPQLGAPFVTAALYYCNAAPRPKEVQSMARGIVSCISPEKHLLGDPFCHFISTFVNIHNDSISPNLPDFFYVQMVGLAHIWAPRLLCFETTAVQNSALDLTKRIITDHLPGRLCGRNEWDTNDAYDARIGAVRNLILTGYERANMLARDADVPRNIVNCLYSVIFECNRFLKALRITWPDRFPPVEFDELEQRCCAVAQIYRDWPESDEYDSAFSGEEELEYTDNDIEAA